MFKEVSEVIVKCLKF